MVSLLGIIRLLSHIDRYGRPTIIDFFNPYFYLLQAQSSFGATVVFVSVDMEYLFAGAR